jgi:hypothetical protein
VKKARGSFSSPVLFRNYGGLNEDTPAWRRVSASARLPGIRRHPGFHEHLTHSRGRWKWRPWLSGSSAWIPSGPAREQDSDNGCSENGRVGLLRRSAQMLTHCSPAGTTGTLEVASRGFSRERSRRRVACSTQTSVGGQTDRTKVTVCSRGTVAHWCARARVDRLQNSVSGIWLKKRTSVAAEVSGRGLALRD